METTANIPARMDRIAAANYLGLSIASLNADVTSHRLKIPYLKLGRRVIYVRIDLDKWMAAHAVNAPASV